MNKLARQSAIKDIIETFPIGSQDDLRHRLRRQGFQVTQATLSRDMREMGVSRVAAEAGTRYRLEGAGTEAKLLQPLVGAEVVSIEASETLIVVRTLPGCANTVGEFIDLQGQKNIIGTVAGDNTLLVIPGSGKKTKKVVEFLRKKLQRGV